MRKLQVHRRPMPIGQGPPRWWVICTGCGWWATQLGDEIGRRDALNMAQRHARAYPSHLFID